MAGIGLIGGIGQALVAGGGGVLQGKEDQRIIDLQNEQLEQQREDRRRKQEREDYTFDRVKDAGEAEDEQNEQSLFDYANKGLDPWNDLEKLIDMPVRPGKTKTMGDVDPNAISEDGDSLGKLPGGAEPKPRTGKTPAMNKMTLGDFADQGEEVKRKIALARDDYEKHRQKVQDDAMAIVKRFSGNPEMQKRKLSAYYRAMTASSDFKTREANYQNLLEKAKQVKIAEASLEVLKALRSGDPKAMAELGLVNADGTPMKVAKDRLGNPIGLIGPMGLMMQQSIMAAAALEKGIGTWDEYKKAMADDGKIQEAMSRDQAGVQKASFSVSVPKEDSILARSKRVAELKKMIRGTNDSAQAQEWKDELESLQAQTPNNTSKAEDRDQEFKLKALNSHVKSCAWAKGKGKPTANEVIKGYETLQAMTDTETADMYLAQVTSSWSKHGEELMRGATEYWKSKVRQLNPKTSAQNR